MKYPACIVLVILVFSTIPNHAQQIKSNARRAAGLVAYPRIGRHLAMASFARADGSAGLVNYPRVGRSGSPFSPASREPENGPRDFQMLSKIDTDRDFDPENVDDFDFSGNHPDDFDETRKRIEELKNEMWLGSQLSSDEKKALRHLHRCSQQVDGPWALLFTARDMASLKHRPVQNFGPRLARDVDRYSVTPSNVVS